MEYIKKFISDLDQHILLKEDFDYSKIGLLDGGITGIIYYCFYSKNQALKEKGFSLLGGLVDYIVNHEVNEYPYCNGVVGFLFLLNDLKHNDFLEDDIEVFSKPVEDFILSTIIPTDYKLDNKELLYGIFGYLHYLASKPKSINDEKNIIAIIDDLLRQCIKKDDTIYLTNNYYNQHKITFGSDTKKRISDVAVANLGLAHGNLALGLILIDVVKKYPEQDYLKDVICSIANIYVNNFKQDNVGTTLFPNFKIEGEVNPKYNELYNTMPLSWCYGDLSVALFLYKTFQITDIDAYEDIAHIVIDKHIAYTNPSNQDLDLGYCHGYVGVVAQYESLYSVTKKDVIKQESLIWKQMLSKSIMDEFSKEGDKSMFLDSHLNMLNGVLSLGLLFNAESTEWKKVFLN